MNYSIDPWCIENCDPNKVEALEGVNTEICEQLFRKVNSHSNCKSMNESKYFLFWLYNLDLHNLDIEDLVCASDPRTEYRWLKTKIIKVDIKDLQKMSFDVGTETEVNLITGKLGNVTLEPIMLSILGSFIPEFFVSRCLLNIPGFIQQPNNFLRACIGRFVSYLWSFRF